MLSIPESKLRVVAPDVGGGFGSKIYVYPEEAVCTWASKKLQRPIKWTADRSESFLADAHGRDHINKVRMALDKDNQITGLRVDSVANIGSYLSAFCGDTNDPACSASVGLLRDPAIYTNVKGMATTTAPVDAYGRRPSGSHLSSGAGDGQGGAPGRWTRPSSAG